MRIALISDIHSNLTALEAVLADLPPVDRIVCCGDLVEYYDQPTIRSINREAARDNYRISSWILAIVKSMPFQMKRASDS